MYDHDAWVENVGLEKLNQIYMVENARLKILGPDGVVVNWSVATIQKCETEQTKECGTFSKV